MQGRKEREKMRKKNEEGKLEYGHGSWEGYITYDIARHKEIK